MIKVLSIYGGKVILSGTVGLFMFYSIIQLIFTRTIEPINTILSAFCFAAVWSIIDVFINYRSLKSNGYYITDLSKLESNLSIEKTSRVSLDEIIQKINNYKQFTSFRIIGPEGSMIKLRPKFSIVYHGDPVVIEKKRNVSEAETLYSIQVLQQDSYDLKAFVENYKNLNIIKHYL